TPPSPYFALSFYSPLPHPPLHSFPTRRSSDLDTAAALTELGLAVEIEPNDPALRLYNGYVLRLARRYTEAVAELDVAIRLDPYRSEEHTSELQSLAYLVCRLLLEKKKQKT